MAGMIYENVRVSAGFYDAAAGTSAVPTVIGYDMQDYDEIAFLIFVGDSTSGSVVTYQVLEHTTATASGGTAIELHTVSAGALTAGDLVTTAGASDIDDKIIIINVKKSQLTKRYCYLTATPATQNTAFNGCVVLQTSARAEPVTQSSYVYAVAKSADGVN